MDKAGLIHFLAISILGQMKIKRDLNLIFVWGKKGLNHYCVVNVK